VAASLTLHRVDCDALPPTAHQHFEPTGIAGVLSSRDDRAHRAPGLGEAAEIAYAWRLRDQWTNTWWPQGVAVGEHDGIPLAIVSWYAQPRRGVAMGARLSIVDLRDARHPRYHHVLLVTPRATDGSVEFDPVPVHAGGIAWSGDRLLVAATFNGLLEFRLSDILSARHGWPFNGRRRPFGYRHVLPIFARYQADDGRADRMRYSFIALDDPIEPNAGNDLRLVAGEFGRHAGLRLARVTLTDVGGRVSATHPSPVAHMQGVAIHDRRWYVTSSEPGDAPGDLWTGPVDALEKHGGVLPPGPQALCVWPARHELWSVSEVAGRRRLYSIDLTRW
jgi:hypothetical protein